VKKITAVLIDDELSALNGLKQKIEKLFPSLEILNAFSNPEEAIEYLNKDQPDLVFLDIEMPRINGFELLSALGKIDFQVIFVTAYSEYALQALRHSAVDYVLKPVDNEELKLAVDKAFDIIERQEQKSAHQELLDVMQKVLARDHKLIVPTTKGLSFIPEKEVIHMEGYQGYTKIHLNNEKEILSSYSLGKFEKMVGPTFFKCHKSHIVNLEKVRSYENEGYLVLYENYRVPISRSKRKLFLSIFNAK
jgi:two-component system LytT family response regulator